MSTDFPEDVCRNCGVLIKRDAAAHTGWAHIQGGRLLSNCPRGELPGGDGSGKAVPAQDHQPIKAVHDSDEAIRIAIGPLDGEPWKVFTFSRVRITRMELTVDQLLKYIDEEASHG